MKDGAMRQANEYARSRRKRRRWQKLVNCLAAMVVFCTTYALILPALTLDKTPKCGMEEHVHGESCYTWAGEGEPPEFPELIHTPSNAEGIHSASDWTSPELEGLIHTPSDAEYYKEEIHTPSDADPVTESETKVHSPSDASRTDETSDDEEDDEDEVYIWEEELINDLPKKEATLICELEESPEHYHTPMCYGDWVLTCDLEEHVHTDECYIDRLADVETPEIWEATLPDPMPELWDEAVLAVAESQLGYKESERNYVTGEDGIARGYTRYGEWYGEPYGDWDGMFASFCLHYAGIPVEAFPQDASCDRWAELLQREACGLYRTKNDYTPKAGDLVFFDLDGDREADHVGLVTELLEKKKSSKIRTIEGNVENTIDQMTYDLEDEQILGYGELPQMRRKEIPGMPGIMAATVLSEPDVPFMSVPHKKAVELLEGESGETYVATWGFAENAGTSGDMETAAPGTYRVYLDVTGQEVPMDVLFVISHPATDAEKQEEFLKKVESFLDGEGGLLADVLAQNEGNRAAVYTLDADTGESSLLMDWTEEKTSSGKEGRPKVMVFLDGDTAGTDTIYQERALKAFSFFSEKKPNVKVDLTQILSIESLRSELAALYKPDHVSITNRLGNLENIPKENPDYRLTMEHEDGIEIVLYENGEITSSGETVLQEIRYDSVARTVSALFQGDYILQPGYTYTFSFNIKKLPGQDADTADMDAAEADADLETTAGFKQAGFRNTQTGYLSLASVDEGTLQAGALQAATKADTATDGSGQTETGRAETETGADTGADAVDVPEDAAFVTYTVEGQQYSEGYGRAVTQATEIPTPPPTNPFDFTGISFPHHKRIDAFRDNKKTKDNPDTTVDDNVKDLSNLYRLYLDVEPLSYKKPMDLLLVLDNSYSMILNEDKDGNKRYKSMNKAVMEFIPKFLEYCEGNRISIVYFNGPSTVRSIYESPEKDTAGEGTPNIEEDAWIHCGWVNNVEDIEALREDSKNMVSGGGAGTNYAAGLRRAQEILDADTSSNEKCMVFLSDGVPTHFIKEDGTRGGNGLSSEGGYNPNIPNNGLANEKYCKNPTLTSIYDFRRHFPDMPIYAISYSASLNSDGANDCLTAMVQNGGAFSHTETSDGLLEAFQYTMSVSANNLIISDELSVYADLYSSKPDYKVTRTRKSDNYTEVLYENDKVTDAGIGIISDVVYTENPETISAVFEEDHVMGTGYIYTLSFNVIASEEAHAEYKRIDGKYITTGDPDTDYGANHTSSEEFGFHSNNSASVSYEVGETPNAEKYTHPVIQVTPEELVVEKKWAFPDGTDVTDQKNGSITFDLYRQAWKTVKVPVEAEKVTVNVQYRHYGAFGVTQYTNCYSTSVEKDKKATIVFTKNRYDREIDGLEILYASGKIETVANSKLEKLNPGYLYTFTASENITIHILGRLEPTVNSLDCEPSTPVTKLEPVGDPVKVREKPYVINAANGWKLVISGLSATGETADHEDIVQYTYWVKEPENPLYTTGYDNNGIVNGTITIKNTITPDHELPQSGGTGTNPYTRGGLLSMTAAAIALLYKKKKRRKEDLASS